METSVSGLVKIRKLIDRISSIGFNYNQSKALPQGENIEVKPW
jgi:hypothetical protein